MYIYKAGVIGAGAMGAEIAQVISYAGIPVILNDINQQLVDKGIDHIRKIYQKRVDKGKMSAADLEKKMALVSGAAHIEGLKESDIVIEAVPEKIALKKEVFSRLDAVLNPSAMMASNTSALSISALGSATKRPDKVIGLHFFYPAHVMKLLEVIPGLATSDETVDACIGFSESLRKIPIRVNECAGFLINRLLMPYLNECAIVLGEGQTSARKMDEAITRFGLPMGPFTLVDTLGLDVCKDVGEVLLNAYGPRMQPAPIWRKLHDQKRYGVKNGGGFYAYPGAQEDAVLAKAVQDIQKESSGSSEAFSVERVLYPMINEAALCLEEHVSTAREIDLGVIAGLGFPREKEGLLHYADTVGLDKILETLMGLYEKLGERFWPAPRLRRMVDAGFLGKKAGRGFFSYT